MKIGFIGAGKVGTAFGTFLNQKGINITGYYSRSKNSAQKASSITNSIVFDNPVSLVKKSDLIFITTPDDVIETIAKNLSKNSLDLATKIICHMSGALDSNYLNLLLKQNATTASLHPMLAFSDLKSSVKALQKTTFTLEGKGQQLTKIKNLLEYLNLSYIEINTKQKTLYHASACIVSNYLVTLLDIGIDMLCHVGFNQETALKLIKPLITQTIQNILNSGTKKALTGPISRGDLGTIQKHLEKLNDTNNKDWLKLYQTLGVETVNLAYNAGKINEDSKHKLQEVFKQYE